MLTRIRKELQIILNETNHYDSTIIAVYIFGSSVTGKRGSNSDLDLAFLLNDAAYKEDSLAAMVPSYMAATRLAIKFGVETDVTILNAASLEIAYEVVTSGLCLFETDPGKRLEYEVALRGMYFDFKPFLDDLRSSSISHL